MRLSRIASPCLVMLTMVATACDPGDEGPPPMTAANVAGTAAPADVTPQPQPLAEPAGGDDGTRYASDEYVIGEDKDSYDDNDPSALSDFRQTLDPYGAWQDDATYGTVWVPSATVVGPDFQPYVTAGHWVYDDDYVWVSDYPWGWAPFHYGRWVYIEGRGWAWIPGRVYRGAWVAWGVDGGYGYVGWYPMPPAFLWFGGVAVGYSFYVGPRWVYCPRGEVFAPAVGTRIVTGGAVGPVAASVRPYVPATPGVAHGPEPMRLGYSAAQVPHASGAAAANVARAQQFARPSTAVSLGAHPPARVSSTVGMGAPGHVPYAGASPSGGFPSAHGSSPSFGHPAPGGSLHPPGGTLPAPGGLHPTPGPVHPGLTPGQPQPARKRPTSSPPPPHVAPHGSFHGSFHGGGHR